MITEMVGDSEFWETCWPVLVLCPIDILGTKVGLLGLNIALFPAAAAVCAE